MKKSNCFKILFIMILIVPLNIHAVQKTCIPKIPKRELDTSYRIRTINLTLNDGTIIGKATGNMASKDVTQYTDIVNDTYSDYDTWKRKLPIKSNVFCYDIGVLRSNSGKAASVTSGVFTFTFFVDKKFDNDTVYINADANIHYPYLKKKIKHGSFSFQADTSTDPMSSIKNRKYPIMPLTQGGLVMFSIDHSSKQKENNHQADSIKKDNGKDTYQMVKLVQMEKNYQTLKAAMHDTKIIDAYRVTNVPVTAKKITFPIDKKYNGKNILIEQLQFGDVVTFGGKARNGKVDFIIQNHRVVSTSYMLGINNGTNLKQTAVNRKEVDKITYILNTTVTISIGLICLLIMIYGIYKLFRKH